MKNWVVSITVAMTLYCAGCTVPADDFSRLMRQEGVTKAVDDGFTPFGCADGDEVKNAFSGVKNGVPVRGVVCGNFSPFGKAYTVRYY